MITHSELLKKGHEGVKILRDQTLRSGHPFLIDDDALPENQTYREYPDGRITLEQLNDDETKFVLVRTLDTQQAKAVREHFLSSLR